MKPVMRHDPLPPPQPGPPPPPLTGARPRPRTPLAAPATPLAASGHPASQSRTHHDLPLRPSAVIITTYGLADDQHAGLILTQELVQMI